MIILSKFVFLCIHIIEQKYLSEHPQRIVLLSLNLIKHETYSNVLFIIIFSMTHLSMFTILI